MESKEITYTSLTGEQVTVELKKIDVNCKILHATPDKRIKSILQHGLKINMPPTKRLINIGALHCTKPSPQPSTADLFRYYDDWSVVVIDTGKIPDLIWYEDVFAQQDASNNGENKHIMTFMDIPLEVIEIIKP